MLMVISIVHNCSTFSSGGDSRGCTDTWTNCRDCSSLVITEIIPWWNTQTDRHPIWFILVQWCTYPENKTFVYQQAWESGVKYLRVCSSTFHLLIQVCNSTVIASFPGHSQILSRSCGENSQLWRKLHSCEIKSGSGLGMRQVMYVWSNLM